MTDYLRFRMDFERGEIYPTPKTDAILKEFASSTDVWAADFLRDLMLWAENYYADCLDNQCKYFEERRNAAQAHSENA
jgi:hypothetical protein